ncbi:unnamed protein product [Trichogramma brassicae]|uniref:Uncharacterized protein n=1 Tax=Trichogramma brassicae TaxID=86971 RepID=A0A6H5HYT3_9HYME|nr:unnamed protein product [Trichogramma brassicae]
MKNRTRQRKNKLICINHRYMQPKVFLVINTALAMLDGPQLCFRRWLKVHLLYK